MRRDHLIASFALTRRVEQPRWSSIEAIAPRWIVHRLVVHGPADLEDPELAALACESNRDLGEQRSLAARRRGPSGVAHGR